MPFTAHGLRLMGYPDPAIEYHLPSLEDLFDRNVANVSLDRAFGGTHIPSQYPYFNMAMNLIRLTDLSISRYEASRNALQLYRDRALDGHVSPFYDAINGLEETVVATYRACLNSTRLAPAVPRQLNEPTTRQMRLIKQVRHHIQHMDEKLETGQVSQRAPVHMIVPLSRSMVIGRKELSYRDLASCITKMYRNIEIIRRAPSK